MQEHTEIGKKCEESEEESVTREIEMGEEGQKAEGVAVGPLGIKCTY